MKLSSYLSWVVLVLALFAALGGYLWTRSSKSAGIEMHPVETTLEEFGKVPGFSFPSHIGEALSLKDLKGKVWVLYSFFAGCPSICPVMNKNMMKVQEAFKEIPEFKIVGITVNPKDDTVQLLSKYSENFKAIPGKWYYLTGEKKPIYTLLREGFKLGTEEVPPAERGGPNDFIHSEKFVLVDREGTIRGYYNGTDVHEVETLIVDAKRLLATGLGQ
jgi:protein SCO1/2